MPALWIVYLAHPLNDIGRALEGLSYHVRDFGAGDKLHFELTLRRILQQIRIVQARLESLAQRRQPLRRNARSRDEGASAQLGGQQQFSRCAILGRVDVFK